MRKWYLICCFLPIVAFAQQPSSKDCCKSNLDVNNLKKENLCTLSKSYLMLKQQKDNCCSNFSADLRPIMEELGLKISDKHLSIKKLHKYLGKPDAFTISKQHQIPYQLQEGESFVIYFWRGWHDYLYFVVKNNRVIKSSWYYAYE